MPYLSRYEWFTTARRARAVLTGKPDPMLTLPLMFWPTWRPAVKVEHLEKPADEVTQTVIPSEVQSTDEESTESKTGDNLIDRFLEHGDYRIAVPEGEQAEVDVLVEVDIEIDPELVTVELAEIYRTQGLHEKADAIFRLLAERNEGCDTSNQ